MLKIKDILLTVLIFVVVIETFLIALGIGIINDLKATANGYQSDRNLCRSQLDSLTQEIERMQDE